MKIKVKEKRCTYSENVWQYIININGKEVKVRKWDKQDSLMGDYDGDYEVFEGEEKLTDEESDALMDFINEGK